LPKSLGKALQCERLPGREEILDQTQSLRSCICSPFEMSSQVYFLPNLAIPAHNLLSVRLFAMYNVESQLFFKLERRCDYEIYYRTMIKSCNVLLFIVVVASVSEGESDTDVTIQAHKSHFSYRINPYFSYLNWFSVLSDDVQFKGGGFFSR
jgi:hypothetical protein